MLKLRLLVLQKPHPIPNHTSEWGSRANPVCSGGYVVEATVDPTILDKLPSESGQRVHTNCWTGDRWSCQGVIPAPNAKVICYGTRPISTSEDLLFFMIRSKVEAMSRKEQEKAYVSSIYIDLRPLYDVEVVAKSSLSGHVIPCFKKFDGRQINEREHVVRFLDSMQAHANNTHLLRELSKYLKDRAYTRYVNLNPRSMHD